MQAWSIVELIILIALILIFIISLIKIFDYLKTKTYFEQYKFYN